MSKVYREGDKLLFGPEAPMLDGIPKGNWLLKYDPDRNFFYLESARPFSFPEKIYGNVKEDVDFYCEAYRTTPKNLGILLNGEKGSGKTLLTTLLTKELDLPVVMITSGYRGPTFVKFMDDIPNPVVVMVDEFDKIYSGDYNDENGQRVSSQTDLLRIMDAGNANKKLFILTSNRVTLSEYMINRPSRIKYSQTFDKLSEEVIEDLLNDRLTEETKCFKDDFFEVTNVYGTFNLDSLLVLVDEVNRLKISPKKAIKRMNMEPEDVSYDVTLIEEGKKIDFPAFVDTFDLLTDENIPSIGFRCETAEASLVNGGRKGYARVVEREKLKNFTVDMKKTGFTLTHRTENYSMFFKRRKLVTVAYDF